MGAGWMKSYDEECVLTTNFGVQSINIFLQQRLQRLQHEYWTVEEAG